ncbi:MAG: hypothetical protein M3Q69_14300 [Acidobacteriota bacterium]|nr:hypothetical protein [Acidobacteriota bacterium]
MFRRTLGEAATFLLFVLLAVALTWPLARQLSTGVSDPGDPLLNAWILDWTSHALLTQPLHLFAAPMFHPSLLPLAYSEHLAGIAILVMPFYIAGVPPVALHNIAMLLAFALSGYGAFVLARMFVRSYAACLVAGIFFAFVSFKFDHLPQVQVVSSGWIALTLAALIAFWRAPSWRNAMLFAAAFAMNGLTNIYYMLFVSAAFGVTLIFLLAAAPRRERRFWLRLGVACLAAAFVLLPFLLPYRTVSKKYQMKRWEGEVVTNGWTSWLVAAPRSFLYGDLAPESMRMAENSLFPGILPIFLTGIALLKTRRRDVDPVTGSARERPRLLRTLDIFITLAALLTMVSLMTDRFVLSLFGRPLLAMRGSDIPMVLLLLLTTMRCAIRMPRAFGGDEGRTLRDAVARSRFTTEHWIVILWLLAGFVGSFGMHAFFFTFLFKRVGPFQSIRAASRFAVVAYAGIAVFVAIGAAALLARRNARTRAIAACVLIALALVDVMPRLRWESAPASIPRLYSWVKKTNAGPMLELPIEWGPTYRYLLGSRLHRTPILNGVSGFEPPEHRSLREAWETNRFDDLFAAAQTHGAKLLVVHGHWLDGSHREPLVHALRAALADGRIAFLQRFDHGIEGDYVFALKQNMPQWAALRAPEAPNGAGWLPEQTLERFFNNQPMHNDTPFGALEAPQWDANVKGSLQVNGWAISPNGVRHIYLHFDDRRYRVEATRIARPDVSSLYGWYYESLPGFTATIPDRPGRHKATDVQVEIVDRNGRSTWLDDVFFNWDSSS